MSRLPIVALALALALAAGPAAAQDPFARNAAVRDAAFYVEAVAQTLDAQAKIADRIVDLAQRARTDRFGAPKLDEQAQDFIAQFDALGRDMADGRRNLIAPGAADWRADLVGARHVFGAEVLDARTLRLRGLSLAAPDAAAAAIEPAQAAAKRLRAARDRYRKDVQTILAQRMEEPEPAAPETKTLGETTAAPASAPPDDGLMADIIRNYAR